MRGKGGVTVSTASNGRRRQPGLPDPGYEPVANSRRELMSVIRQEVRALGDFGIFRKNRCKRLLKQRPGGIMLDASWVPDAHIPARQL